MNSKKSLGSIDKKNSETGREMLTRMMLENKSFLESVAPKLLDSLWVILDSAIVTPVLCFKGVIEEPEDKDHLLWLMLCNVLSDILSAYELTLQGFVRPPAVTLRCAVETLAGVVAFMENDKLFEKYKAGRIQLKDVIKASKKQFPILVKHWGTLSEKFVHETFESIDRSVGREKGIYIIPKMESSLHAAQVNLFCMIGMIAYDMAEITEWCFLKHFEELKFWRVKSKTEIISIDNPSKRAVLNLAKRLEASVGKK